MLELARNTLHAVTQGNPWPKAVASKISPRLKEPRACFVTLTKHGQLRGCIGQILPKEPLYLAVQDRTRAAALEDFRFHPVEAKETSDLLIEISVLTIPQRLHVASPTDLLQKLRPHEDGVLLKWKGAQATFLPQVWEQLPDPVSFLQHLARKLGGPPELWKSPEAEVWVYHVEAFKELEPRNP